MSELLTKEDVRQSLLKDGIDPDNPQQNLPQGQSGLTKEDVRQSLLKDGIDPDAKTPLQQLGHLGNKVLQGIAVPYQVAGEVLRGGGPVGMASRVLQGQPALGDFVPPEALQVPPKEVANSLVGVPEFKQKPVDVGALIQSGFKGIGGMLAPTKPGLSGSLKSGAQSVEQAQQNPTLTDLGTQAAVLGGLGEVGNIPGEAMVKAPGYVKDAVISTGPMKTFASWMENKMLPSAFNVTTNVAKPLTAYFIKHPEVIDEVAGSPQEIEQTVQKMQGSLKTYRDAIGQTVGGTKSTIGAADAEIGAIHSLAGGNVSVHSPQEIATQFLGIKKIAPSLDATEEAKRLYDLRGNIDDVLHFSPPGTVLQPAENKAQGIVRVIRNQINQRLDSLAESNPVVSTLRNNDAKYEQAAKLYDTLRGSLGKEGAAEDKLSSVFTKDTAQNRNLISSLQDLDKATGQNLTEDLMRQFVSKSMANPIGKPFLAAIAIRDAMTNPAHIPRAMAMLSATSPAFMSRAYNLAGKAGGTIESAASKVGELAHPIAKFTPLSGAAEQDVNTLIQRLKSKYDARRRM